MTLGLEISDKGCQITYKTGADVAPQVVTETMDSQEVIIPTVAVMDSEMEEFIFGNDALEYHKSKTEEDKPRLLTDLFKKAVEENSIITNGHEYDAYEIFANYVRWLLSLTAFVSDWRMAEHIVFVCERISPETVKLFKRLALELEMENRISIIGYQESIFEYVIHQNPELWHHDVMILDYEDKGVTCKIFNVNKRTKPAVCTVTEIVEPSLEVRNDEELKRFCQWQAEDRVITSVYMVGTPLDKSEIAKTLTYLCMKRRVFQGQNLYAKGACYAAFRRAHLQDDQDKNAAGYLFLGEDILQTNVGVKVYKGHEEIYVPFVDAGVNWYEINKSYEMYLGRERELRLLVTPITGENEHNAVIRLSSFPARPEHTTRVKIMLHMETKDRLTITIEDMGFGQIFPASGQVVTEKIKI